MKSRNGYAEIGGFKSILPPMCASQEEATQWMVQMYSQVHSGETSVSAKNLQKQIQEKVIHYSVKPQNISKRYFECPDIGNSRWEEMEIYGTKGSDFTQKNEFYLRQAKKVLSQMYTDTNQSPDHMIHVTCTGYGSPSAVQQVISEKDWGQKTQATHAYHMGCYASVPAIRSATGFISQNRLLSKSDSSYQVDIVHTEMCSLHFDPLVDSPEQIIIQSLFADGHIKYSLTSPGHTQKGFRLLGLLEEIVPDSADQMKWIPQSWGFRMSLGRDVPMIIGQSIRPFVERLFKKSSLDLGDMNQALFAIHPGGPKIIDSAQTILELSPEQVAHSKNVLQNRGNMSSATLPHVWMEILNDDPSSGQLVISLAFGPGLTIFGTVFEVI